MLLQNKIFAAKHIYYSSGSTGGAEGAMPPPPALYKQVIKKMATKGGHIDFMFLAHVSFFKFFWGPLIPLFWASDDICSGFQSQSGQPYLHWAEAYVIYIPLVRHLLTSWRLAWQPIASPHAYFIRGRIPDWIGRPPAYRSPLTQPLDPLLLVPCPLRIRAWRHPEI